MKKGMNFLDKYKDIVENFANKAKQLAKAESKNNVR